MLTDRVNQSCTYEALKAAGIKELVGIDLVEGNGVRGMVVM